MKKLIFHLLLVCLPALMFGQANQTVTPPSGGIRIQNRPVTTGIPLNGDILKYNSTSGKWELATDNAGVGTVTSVVAGAGISIAGTADVTVTNTANLATSDITISADRAIDVGSFGLSLGLIRFDKSGTNASLGNTANGTLQIKSNSLTALAISNNQCVGIGGLTSPPVPLSIGSSTAAGDGNSISTGKVSVSDAVAGGAIAGFYNSSTTGYGAFSRTAASASTYYIHNFVYGPSAISAMWVGANGRVGVNTTSPNAHLDVIGSVAVGNIVTKTANYTLTLDDCVVIHTAGTGSTFTIPTASSTYNRVLYVIRADGAGTVTVSGGYSGSVTTGNSLHIKCDGTTWYKIN